ncbi:MAG: cell division FtsZ family protein [Tannerella sp.]|jgi:cell division protein FtsZ|nr:cell division FtsZ family protein [Tannerella sp.]
MSTEVDIDFDFPREAPKIIKVIGIGGGGVNAVNYMYESGIRGVNFAVCNTDFQSFDGVKVPVKVTLGSGLGAGGKPEIAREEFEKSAAEVEKLLTDGTKMVFIAAGMGGGTGSGAAPLLARMAKEKSILTVGIVTIPFRFEKTPRITTALKAVDEMYKNVDALIVINNERLKEHYSDFDLNVAFKKPDEVLAMAVKSVAEIITVKGIINRDFNDVASTMKDSGVALVSYGFGHGENRLDDAINEALESPLLSNNDLYNAKRILFYISFPNDAHFKVEELDKYMDAFMSNFDEHIEMIWGFGLDENLPSGQEIKFTIIATGFSIEAVPAIKEMNIEIAEGIAAAKAADEQRVKDVYGDEGKSMKRLTRVPQSNIVILNDEELYDDDLIKYLESTPTCLRQPADIAAHRRPTAAASALAAEAATSASPASYLASQAPKPVKAENLIEF